MVYILRKDNAIYLANSNWNDVEIFITSVTKTHAIS